ncbi:hypothetical protein DFJ73DRAFT_779327 [Zopfochytrium polystomum]|nr:hypothetical protein DFJ73DRAFT_779327 [Zopfochytrium polystomum]
MHTLVTLARIAVTVVYGGAALPCFWLVNYGIMLAGGEGLPYRRDFWTHVFLSYPNCSFQLAALSLPAAAIGVWAVPDPPPVAPLVAVALGPPAAWAAAVGLHAVVEFVDLRFFAKRRLEAAAAARAREATGLLEQERGRRANGDGAGYGAADEVD